VEQKVLEYLPLPKN